MKQISLLALLAFAAPLIRAADGPISQEEAKKLKNPVAFNSKSIAEGKSSFIRMCASCH